MAKLNWDRARPWKPTEQAFPTDGLARQASRAEKAFARRLGLTDELADRELGKANRGPASSSQRRGMTMAEINAARTPQGGFSRESFIRLGVPYPPPKGWIQKLLRGTAFAPTDPQARTGGDPVSIAGPTTITDYPGSGRTGKAPWED